VGRKTLHLVSALGLFMLLFVLSQFFSSVHPDQMHVLDQSYEHMQLSRESEEVLALATGLTESQDHSNVSAFAVGSMRPLFTSVRVPGEVTCLKFCSPKYELLVSCMEVRRAKEGVSDADAPAERVSSLYWIRNASYSRVGEAVPGRIFRMSVSSDYRWLELAYGLLPGEVPRSRIVSLSDQRTVLDFEWNGAQEVFFPDKSETALVINSSYTDVLGCPPEYSYFTIECRTGEMSRSLKLKTLPLSEVSVNEENFGNWFWFSSIDGSIVAASFSGGQCAVAEVVRSEDLRMTTHMSRANLIRWSDNARLVGLAWKGELLPKGSIYFVDQDSWQLLPTRMDTREVTDVAFSNDGTRLFVLRPGGNLDVYQNNRVR
jgi:hypothetical protein